MSKRSWIAGGVAVAALAGLAFGVILWAGWWSQPVLAAPPSAVQPAPLQQDAPDADAYVQSYAAKFVCTEALQPGVIFKGPVAPLVQQKTDVLVHNPNGFALTFFKKAVIAPLELFGKVEQDNPIGAPGKYYQVRLQPDRAFRIDCDDIAKLLTGNANATFIGTYGVGVTVEGFVVILNGPQTVAGTTQARIGPLDVTAEYVRSSEVMKKDIHFQPWWSYWPTPIPQSWVRLGYALQRVLPLSPEAAQGISNIDCRGELVKALDADVTRELGTGAGATQARQGLQAGSQLDPTNLPPDSDEGSPALVPLIGRCDKVFLGSGLGMSVDYVLVSTVSPTAGYPWHPGRWYDLALVVPQNLDIDLDNLLRDWQTQRWLDAGGTAANVNNAMRFYFPYWCGWGYWWWWWNAGDCIDIGVGEGESLDVEQVTPVRVLLPNWPPATTP